MMAGLPPAAGVTSIIVSNEIIGHGARTSFPARYPAELIPIRVRNGPWISGICESEAGSDDRMIPRKPKHPTSVHTKNWKRSPAIMPPLLMKSDIDGWIGPEPFDP